MTTYEDVLWKLPGLPVAEPADERDIVWLTDAKVVGISRSGNGQIEIFLNGPKLEPSSQILKESIEYQQWYRMSGDPTLDANRLLLPAAGHFDQVAAFICTELLRNGADADLVASFGKTEPIIELAVQRLRISHQALLGLTGEMLLLSALCQRANDDQVAQVVASWDGWQQSIRDFTWGSVGVEVKTTTRAASTHLVQGLHQVEPVDGEDGGEQETGLFLVSVGLQMTDPHDNSVTLPSLVDRVVDRLRAVHREDAVPSFLARVREYGSGSGLGYDHATLSRDAIFARPYSVRFVRAYDMTDAGVEVLRTVDVLPHQHVDVHSLSFRINLPASVTGDLNPVVGAHQVASAIFGAAAPKH